MKAILEALDLVTRPFSSDEREALVKRAKEELAALTALPEDVERDRDVVLDGLRDLGLGQGTREWDALSRLATAAARVPGLGARSAELMNERDANRQEMKSERERARTAESERDAARQEVETLRTAYGNALTKGTAAEQEAGRLRMACSNLETENARLTARVAEMVSPLHGKEVPTETLVAVSPSFVKLTAPPDAYVKDGGCDVCDFQEAGKLHKWHCVYRNPSHYEDSDGMEVHLAQSEPAAPDVAWEGDGVRVLADGTWEMLEDCRTQYRALNILALALAEAKREAREWMDRCDHRPCHEAHQEEMKNASRKAAEDMRERAENAAWDAMNKTDCTMGQWRAVRDAIRAEHLESK